MMHQNGDRSDFIDTRNGEKHHTAFGPWKNRWLVFDRNRASLLGSEKLQLVFPYAGCPKEREYVLRLSTFPVLLKDISGSSEQVFVYTALAPAL